MGDLPDAARAAAAGAAHPLDPLTPEEIRAAGAAILEAHPELGEPRFPLLTLAEPSKELVHGWRPGAPVHRRAFAVVFDTASGAVFEAQIDLSGGARVDGWTPMPGVQPSILLEEVMALQDIVRRDDGARAALAKRGVTDVERVQFDPWTSGTLPIEGVDPGRRLLRATATLRQFPEDNPYAHPIENLVFVVDLTAARVVKVIDGGVVLIPTEHGNYDAASVGALRTDLRAIDISQPDGPSFTIEGNRIRWQRWSLHVSVHAVEGLVLHDVRYEDQGRERSILYRAGLAEMVVPYGDPSITFGFRSVFDAGEYNLGRFVSPLRLGCDCLGEIRYLDVVLADERGEPMTVPNAICVHEEDIGVLWKHWDFLAREEGEVRRARRLVVSTWHTVGNYEYGFFWHFGLDGSIGFEVKLTGIMATKAIEPGDDDGVRYGALVAPALEAPNHQHLFCMRLDLDVDGTSNTVYEVDAVGVPAGEGNPNGTAFVGRETVVASEREGGRSIDPASGRFWKIVDPSVTNRLGQPVGYKLIPHQGPLLAAAPDSHVALRAGFAKHHLWVTRYDPAERHAAGDYPNQHAGGDGLPRWVEQDRQLEDEDIVLWHVMGTSHLPRPEDWPVMPVEVLGFTLKPAGFFDRNPALDVPPPPGH
jgi:primary-amine oxidase